MRNCFNDSSPPVELKATALVQKFSQASPRPLNSGLGAGKGDTQVFGQLLLSQALILRQPEGFPVFSGKLIQKSKKGGAQIRQVGFWRVHGQVLRKFLRRSGPARVINQCVAGDSIQPGFQFVTVPQRG